MKSRKETTPYKLNTIVSFAIRDSFKDSCHRKQSMGMSPVLRNGVIEFIRDDLDVTTYIGSDNINLSDSYRINIAISKELQDAFKDKCKEKGVSMSQWLRAFILYYIDN